MEPEEGQKIYIKYSWIKEDLSHFLMEDKMNYQLVLQFKGETEDDFDLLIEIEDKLEDGLGEAGEVNGHDFGSNEMNIFIYSSEPKKCFEKSKRLIENMDDIKRMKAAYRDIDSENFTVLWPVFAIN
jgi:hypothetical protein